MKRTNSELPMIKLEKSYITKQPLPISKQASSQNEKYFKMFEMLQNVSSKSVAKNFEKLETLKVHQTSAPVDFSNLIESLDVVANEQRFIKQRLVLCEKVPMKGYIDANCFQYFEVNVQDCYSPLRLLLKTRKGHVILYMSFKNPRPDKYSNDRTYENEFIEIHGRESIFREPKCYLSVLATTGSSISITYFYELDYMAGMDKHAKQMKSIAKKRVSHIDQLALLRNDPLAKLQFEQKVKSIQEKQRLEKIAKRKLLNKTQNFVLINKTGVGGFKNKYKEIEKKMNGENKKIELVKTRKKDIDMSRSENMEMMINRKDIREMAEKKALEINGIVFRKLFFEKNWLKLINFSLFTVKIREVYLYKKHFRKNFLLSNMQARKIAKNYKYLYKSNFPLTYRNLALMRNHLKLYRASMLFQLKKRSSKILSKFIQAESKYKTNPLKFQRFIFRIRIIQRVWRKYMQVNNSYFLELLEDWNRITESIIAQINEKKRSKLKKKIDELSNIPFKVKEKIIKDHLLTCKKQLLEVLKTDKQAKFSYHIDEITYKQIILRAVSINKNWPLQ